MNWSNKNPIDIIDADLCCGFTDSIRKLMIRMICSNGIAENTILSINLMRGRDKATNTIREIIKKDYETEDKHRGKIFHAWFVRQWTYELLTMREKDYELSEENYNDFMKLTNTSMRINPPNFASYKSINNKTIMDSTVFVFEKLYLENILKKDEGDKSVVRQIAAIKAWRTMRLKEASCDR